MTFWLSNQDLSARSEERPYFNKQAFNIWYFVYNPEGQNKIYGAVNAKMVRVTDMEIDVICQVLTFGPPSGAMYHLRLHIQCNDFSARANNFGQGDGEIAKTTTYINDCLSGSGQLAQN